MARLKARLGGFGRDESGNFAILFSFSAVAMTLMMGIGIDYFTSLSAKSRLDAAADAAALAAVNAAKTYYAKNSGQIWESMLEQQAISAGKTAGAQAFAANLSSTTLRAPVSPTISMTYGGLTFSANVAWSASAPSFFGALAGIQSMDMTGVSAAMSQLPKYQDFYLVTDVSASMGIPTSASDQALLMATSPDNVQTNWYYTVYGGCQFACHFNGFSAYEYTQQASGSGVRIPLKLNSVGTAIQNLLTTANATKVIANQYRVGVYPYILDAIQAAPLSTDLSSAGPTAQVAGHLADYLDNGTSNQGMGSGGTHFSTIWNDVRAFLQPVGNGASSASPQPFIVLITDGIDNQQSYSAGAWSAGGSQPVLPDATSTASLCAAAKSAGYTVAVLLIPYTPIVNPQTWFANNEDGVVNYYIDPTLYPYPGNVPMLPAGENVSTHMQACASPGFFFQASDAASINAAMQQIFFQAVSYERLTQ